MKAKFHAVTHLSCGPGVLIQKDICNNLLNLWLLCVYSITIAQSNDMGTGDY